MNYRTPPQRAEELGIDPAKLIIEIKAGRLVAVDLATPGSKRSRYRISEEAIADWLRSRQVRPAVKPQPRRRKLQQGIKQYF